MTSTLSQSFFDQRNVGFQVNEFYSRTNSKTCPVGGFQRRTSQYRFLTCSALFFQQVAHSIQPRLPVGIRKRNSRAHLFDVRRGMEIVRIEKRPAEILRQKTPDNSLARAGNTEHNDGGYSSHSLGEGRHSPEMARSTISPGRQVTVRLIGRQQTVQSSTSVCSRCEVSIASANASPQCGQTISVSLISVIRARGCCCVRRRILESLKVQLPDTTAVSLRN